MGRTVLSRLQPASVLPFASCLLLVLLDVLPFPLAGRPDVFLTLAGVVAWSWRRPEWLSTGAAFALGLLHDVLAGLPAGMTALVLVLARGAIMASRATLESVGPALLGLSCIALVAAGCVGRWLIACVWWGHAFPIAPVLAEFGATVIVLPAILVVIGLIDARMAGPAHASS